MTDQNNHAVLKRLAADLRHPPQRSARCLRLLGRECSAKAPTATIPPALTPRSTMMAMRVARSVDIRLAQPSNSASVYGRDVVVSMSDSHAHARNGNID